MPIETIGKLVLVVLIAVAIIVFIIIGINSQSGAFTGTGSTIIGNLSGRGESIRDTIVIG